jgi:hypothetical protein
MVFACASAVAMLGLPGSATSVGVPEVPRRLALAAVPAPVDVEGVPPVAAPPVAAPVGAPPVGAPPVPLLDAATDPVAGAPGSRPDAVGAREAEAPSPADRDAGIARRAVVEVGSGEFDVAAGSEPAPGPGTVQVVRVEVERDLPVDRDRFASFVLTTLNDPRGWGHGGTMSFARTDGDAPIRVMLASPRTSARLCGSLDTRGRLSCRIGPQVVLTFVRWVHGTEEYADNLTGYRQYVLNHEVGHALGHGHERCPGPGLPAPVMQQQTLGLRGCTQNSWPRP